MGFTVANAEKNTLSEQEKMNKYAVEDYVMDINDTGDSHAILAKRAVGSKMILDVGCGVGYIGKKLKETQKCTVDGIDIDAEACKIAAKYYDSVTLMKIGDEADIEFKKFLKNPKRYDCIICGDIIEHLVDPGYVISILAKKLNQNGKILVSIPNIAHIDVIAGLVDGKFNYGKTGILDSTHLRFFTENSFCEFIANVGSRYKINLHARLIKKTSAMNMDGGVFMEVCGKEIFTFQNIFELTIGKSKYIPKLTKKNYYKKLIARERKLENEVNELRMLLNERDKTIRDIKRSTSWRVTAPMRKVAEGAKKLLKK